MVIDHEKRDPDSRRGSSGDRMHATEGPGAYEEEALGLGGGHPKGKAGEQGKERV